MGKYFEEVKFKNIKITQKRERQRNPWGDSYDDFIINEGGIDFGKEVGIKIYYL